MAKNKTTETGNSVREFISSVEDENKRKDGFALVQLLEQQTGLQARMWGSGIIGFGTYHYRYESGHEGDAPLVAFALRKNAIVLYLDPEFPEREALLQQLGKHKTGKGCVYLNKLADADEAVLSGLVTTSIKYLKAKYPG